MPSDSSRRSCGQILLLIPSDHSGPSERIAQKIHTERQNASIAQCREADREARLTASVNGLPSTEGMWTIPLCKAVINDDRLDEVALTAIIKLPGLMSRWLEFMRWHLLKRSWAGFRKGAMTKLK
jgi:hypothetical protein